MCILVNTMICRLVFALLLATGMGSFAGDDPAASDLVITLERTECYGHCPVYKVTIHGDGSVVYEGKRFVRVTGTRKTTIDQQGLADLIQAFSAINYLDLKDSYTSIHNPDGTESIVTDLPTTYTSFSLGGRRKAVTDYVGAPKELEELEHTIDKIAGTKRWVSIDASSVHEEASRGWNIKSSEAQKLFADAAMRGDADVVRAFITEGADVHARVAKVTLLQRARGVEVVRLLISAGADVNATSKGYFGPPLSFAAKLGDADSIKTLIDAGAKVNGRSPNAETALMEAAKAGNPAIVELLLRAGADAKAKTTSGEDALKYADYGLDRQRMAAKQPDPFDEPLEGYERKYKQIQEMLIAAGAERAK
jgi:hypothetical protein